MTGRKVYPVLQQPGTAVQLACCKLAVPLYCPLCGMDAVVPLDDETLAMQPDDTTHVCHPFIGGCNHGFAQSMQSDVAIL